MSQAPLRRPIVRPAPAVHREVQRDLAIPLGDEAAAVGGDLSELPGSHRHDAPAAFDWQGVSWGPTRRARSRRLSSGKEWGGLRPQAGPMDPLRIGRRPNDAARRKLTAPRYILAGLRLNKNSALLAVLRIFMSSFSMASTGGRSASAPRKASMSLPS